MTGTWKRGGCAALTACAVLAAAPFALARNGADDAPGDDSRRGGDDRADVRRSVACSAGATAKLTLGGEDGGRVEAEFEVDQNRTGVRWNVTWARNGRVVARRSAVTRAPSGSFEVRRVFAAGGLIRATAVNPRGGERCSVSVRF